MNAKLKTVQIDNTTTYVVDRFADYTTSAKLQEEYVKQDDFIEYIGMYTPLKIHDKDIEEIKKDLNTDMKVLINYVDWLDSRSRERLKRIDNDLNITNNFLKRFIILFGIIDTLFFILMIIILFIK